MIRIGTSGWTYQHWKGIFYPVDLPQKRWFEYYTEFFDTVELNATFYRLFPGKTFRGWREKTQPGFRFALKLWRWITHRKKLSNATEDISLFCRRAEILGDRLGPILVQLPPGLKWSAELAEGFIRQLPKNFYWAFEVRNQDWLQEVFFDLLERYGTALVYTDHPYIQMGTDSAFGPFIYVRFHGAGQVYAGNYPDEHLRDWAKRIGKWDMEGKDVWVYFNNDLEGYAVKNAMSLKKRLGA
jgi:uncharacterized protein YecE (DUF72 family)